MLNQIKSASDLEQQFEKLLVEAGTNCRYDFTEFPNFNNEESFHPIKEATLMNRLMKWALEIFKAGQADIQKIMQRVFLVETGLDKVIPFP